MNCKQIKEAIDTASRGALYGAPVTSHLNGCPDCRGHADETNSLLMLLSAQPRVQAPADFDFRLRARIARAQAEQASPVGILDRIGRLLAQTFSFGQAATAMAAVALAVFASTLYINRDNGPQTPANDVAAVNQNKQNKVIDSPQTRMASAPEIKSPVVEPGRLAPVKFSGRSVKAAPAMIKSDAPADVIASNEIASANNLPRFYSRETRQVVQDRNAFGAELVSVNSAKSAPVALTF
ncbi:MAG: hypothetical protein ACREAB_05685 [Blastocatellia bacterium]